MTEPLVSVLIRSMGRTTLNAALASIAAQEYPSIEVAVIAASGNDHPPVPAQCGRFPQRLVGDGRRLPRADAANCGLDAARGDYCVFLDDDDFHDPDHVSGLMATLVANRGMRVAYSRVRVVDSQGQERDGFGRSFDRLALFQQNYIQLGAALFERSLAATCRFDPHVGSYDDWDFWLQCSQHTDFAFRDRASTNWCADAGESGAGDGANFNASINAASREAVETKWAAVRDALVDRLVAHTEAGYAAYGRGDFAAAEAQYRQALAIHPSDSYALNLLALLFDASGRYADAAACLRRAMAAEPDRMDLACNLARVEMRAGRRDIARRLLENILRREPGHADAIALVARLQTSHSQSEMPRS